MDWELVSSEYDDTNGMSLNEIVKMVLNQLGPIICIEPVKSKDFYQLRTRLASKVVVLRESVDSINALYSHILSARGKHLSGEPHLPRKLVAAILLVRKLVRGNYWAGHDKGYLWTEDLAKGRGVDERYQDIIQEVAEDLLRHGVLTFKISQGRKKYAVNPLKKREVHQIREQGEFANQTLLAILTKDKNLVSVRELDN